LHADRSAVEPIVGASTPEIEWLVGDVASRRDVAKATEGCDGVAHLAALLTPAAGLIVTAALLLALLVLGWRLRHAPAGSPSFNLMLSLVLAVTVVIIPTWAPYNQLLLLPALILLVRDWRRLVRFGRLSRLLYLLVAALVVWPGWPRST